MGLKRPTGEALRTAVRERSGHDFADLRLLQRALTHASAQGGAAENNERLEFLGDRVLGLVIAHLLHQTYPAAHQGELSLRFNALVSRDVCADVADELGLVELIRADAAVRSPAGRKGRNVRADAVEALIAAIYLDAGLEAARAFVLRFWEGRALRPATDLRDSKTELQQWVQRDGGSPPAYVIEKRVGPDHDLVFTVRVDVPGHEPARGEGKSRQAAEQAAASAFLAREGVRAA